MRESEGESERVSEGESDDRKNILYYQTNDFTVQKSRTVIK